MLAEVSLAPTLGHDVAFLTTDILRTNSMEKLQVTEHLDFVRCNRVFVIAEFVITKFS